MITANAELISLLNTSSQFYMADLYTFELMNGVTLRYANTDRDIVSGGATFRSNSLLISRDRIRHTVGLEVDELTLTIVFGASEEIVTGLTFPQLLTRGLLDGAKVTLERAFFRSWQADIKTGLLPEPVGKIKRFIGTVAELSYGRTEARVLVKSVLECLNINMPRNLVQASCIYRLFDAGCGASRDTFKHSGAAGGGTTRNSIKYALPHVNGWGDLGFIVMHSGLNAGVKRTIKSYGDGEIKPIVAFPQAIEVGDEFTVYAGCDGKLDTCRDKFNNLGNFRGCPFVPVPEVAL